MSNLIIDCFIFYNELDMLRYRLSTLNEFVDYFIIVEASKTFIGSPKPLYFSEHEYLFAPYLHKIIHIIEFDLREVNEESLKQQKRIGKTDYKTYCWDNERTQRNAIDKGIRELEIKLGKEVMEKSHLIINDCDEIPNPSILKELKEKNANLDIACLEQDFYYYNIRNKMREKWYHSKIVSYPFYVNHYERNSEKIRQSFGIGFIPNGGWHLSYFGDPAFIRNKMNMFSHQEFNIPELTDLKVIEKKINRHQSVVRNEMLDFILERDNKNLPPNILKTFPIPKDYIAD